ncbi:MAG: patatin-like phospholipase family protein [Deltaproteobacteria bacterium]|nr:patatin-like phospholipase family protein [Deltaproteobacteria bacterium]
MSTSSGHGRDGRPRVGLVLAGGAARGAYEVGVVQYILESVAKELGREVPLDVLCGTSVGAINACALAAYAQEPGRVRAARLVKYWTEIRIPDVVRIDLREVLALVRGLVGRLRGPVNEAGRRGGIFDPAGLERIIYNAIRFEDIDRNLDAGHLHGLSVSTTHVATGRTVVFLQRRDGAVPAWSQDQTIVPRAARIRATHALASAAIPMLFPPVKIAGEYYVDGGLRQNVPLSPARRLGADRLVVVNPRYLSPSGLLAPDAAAPIAGVPGPLFLLGKALNALLLDRLDNDIDRLARINAILEAGSRRFGAAFMGAINEELGHAPGRGLRSLEVVLVRSSEDIGKLAGDFVRSPHFRQRAPGMLGRVMRRLAEDAATDEADLLSYMLFDGEFAGQLVEIGRSDARARHDELCAFFEGAVRGQE